MAKGTCFIALLTSLLLHQGVIARSLEVGQPFPDLKLPSIEGRTPRSVSDFYGKKTLVLVYASW